MMRQPFETYDEKTLAEVWKMEVEMSRRHKVGDEEDLVPVRDKKCHSDVALDRVLDEDLRAIMASFWHKGREEFVPFLDSEIAARCRITEYELKPKIERLINLGAMTWRTNNGNRFWRGPKTFSRKLTKIGVSVATADLHARQMCGGKMMPMQLFSIRKRMGILSRHMAARLNIDVEDLIAMEAGKKPITQDMASAIERELKKHNERASQTEHKHGAYND